MTTTPAASATKSAARPAKTLAIVQFAWLTDTQRKHLLSRIFDLIEYGLDPDNETPGRDEDGPDVLAAIYECFNDVEVFFTSTDEVPAGYRFNDHQRPALGRCNWSLRETPEPMQRETRGDIHCPNECPGSVVEADPAKGFVIDTQ